MDAGRFRPQARGMAARAFVKAGEHSMETRSAPAAALPRVAAPLIATLFLLAPALWNGFPLLFFDSGSYLARPFDGSLSPGRSMVYGLLLAGSSFADFWPVVIAQAALSVWVIALVLRTHGFGERPLLLVSLTAVLAAATSLPWLAGQLMPDLFSGLAVLALYLLFRAAALARYEKIGLVALVALAAASHNATLIVLCGLVVAAAGLYLVKNELVARMGLIQGAGALLLGAALLLTANVTVGKELAWTPGGTGFLFSRLVQDGIVARWLADHCPDKRFKLCNFRKTLPTNGDDFLWHGNEKSAFAQIGYFWDKRGEMATITKESLTLYPGMHVATALRSTALQLVMVKSGDGIVYNVWDAYGEIERLTPNAVPAAYAARQRSEPVVDFAKLNLLQAPLAWFSMALIPLWLVFAFRRRELEPLGALAATIGLAILGNALVCGVFSGPHDRYGARLVWMAPFLLVIALAYLAPLLQWLPRPALRPIPVQREIKSG
jgi:hypothetical protein